MSEKCDNKCSDCGKDCTDRKKDLQEKPNGYSNIRKVIAVVSGKGGVGKSFVTSALSVLANKNGCSTAVLDADVTGPSIPKAFGLTEKAFSDEKGILPVKSKDGISIMSLNLLLDNDTDPVVWRGPVIAGAVKQFWSDVAWGDIDLMFVDMPPGTGDVPLTVFQSLPVDGIVVVTSPQELVGMIVEKAVRMAEMMSVPVLALVENMSYFDCPECKARHYIFGQSHIGDIAEKYGIATVCSLPIQPEIAKATDEGRIEEQEISALKPVIDKIIKLEK